MTTPKRKPGTAKAAVAPLSSGHSDDDEPIMPVRLLRPISAQGYPLEAGALIGPPADWAAHLIEHGIAKPAEHPGPTYYVDKLDCRFCLRLSDDQLSQILERRIERIPDPDFPQEAFIRESFTLFMFGGKGPAHPASAEDIAALRDFHKRQTIPARLENARRRLLRISDTPEHADGTGLLKKAEDLRRQMEDPSMRHGQKSQLSDQLLTILDHFSAVIQAGFRRKDVRTPLARDARRQEGTRQPRRPEIDKWIDSALERYPDQTRKGLWNLAPGWIKDEIEVDRFVKRVSNARKRVVSK